MQVSHLLCPNSNFLHVGLIAFEVLWLQGWQDTVAGDNRKTAGELMNWGFILFSTQPHAIVKRQYGSILLSVISVIVW